MKTIRFCPLLPGSSFGFRGRMHNLGQQKVFQCAKTFQNNSWKGECIVCETYDDFYSRLTGNCGFWTDVTTWSFINGGFKNNWTPPFYKFGIDHFINDLHQIRPIDCFNFNVVVRGLESELVQQWSCGIKLYSKILEVIKGHPSNPNVVPLGNITHPETGNDMLIEADNEFLPNFGVPPKIQFLPSSPLGTAKQVELWNLQRSDFKSFASREKMLDALEDIFGNLHDINLRYNQKYRSIFSSFDPAW